jgi:hypothetical protein
VGYRGSHLRATQRAHEQKPLLETEFWIVDYGALGLDLFAVV